MIEQPIDRPEAASRLAALGFVLVETTEAPPAVVSARPRAGAFIAYDESRRLWAPGSADGDDDLARLVRRVEATNKLAGPMTYAEALAVLEPNGFELRLHLGGFHHLTWMLEHRASAWQTIAYTYLRPTVEMAASHLLHIGGQQQASFAELLRDVTLRPFKTTSEKNAERRRQRAAATCERPGSVEDDEARAQAPRERQSSLW